MKISKVPLLYIYTAFFVMIGVLYQPALSGNTPPGVGNQSDIMIRVDGLSCPFCAYGLEKKLKSLKGVENLEINIDQGLVRMFLKEGATLGEKEIQKKIKEAGFTPREIIMRSSVSVSGDQGQKVVLNIEGMRCEDCASRIKTALSKIACTRGVSVDLEKNQAVVLCTGDQKQRQKLVQVVEDLGFKASLKGNGQE